ncbi:MAG: 50S ribosomal protein L21 [Actinobacteria bacterium]|nr:MAG: 50S ribosomal protein L21 [Actinomycetota bacterium]
MARRGGIEALATLPALAGRRPALCDMDGYAIISVGGKQYRVHEGQRLLVDRLGTDEGKTFTPDVLLVGGNGKPDLSPKAGLVTARVVGHVRGDKIRIGKYRPKSGYRRHTGFRASLSQIEIESIGAKKAAPKKAEEEKPKAAAKPKPKAPARKPAAKKTEERDGA